MFSALTNHIIKLFCYKQQASKREESIGNLVFDLRGQSMDCINLQALGDSKDTSFSTESNGACVDGVATMELGEASSATNADSLNGLGNVNAAITSAAPHAIAVSVQTRVDILHTSQNLD